MNKLKGLAVFAFCSIGLCTVAAAQDWQWDHFRLESRDFPDGGTLPISAINEYPLNGSNYCSINGATGGDISPELHWSHAPRGTRSFVVMIYDETASVVHWGMYNIAGSTMNLPQNAGTATSTYGLQVTNFEDDQSYDGPCPPQGTAPYAHRYVFTVYALDEYLDVYAPANFPPSGLTLYRDLLKAGREEHILGSANLIGYYSDTPPTSPAN